MLTLRLLHILMTLVASSGSLPAAWASSAAFPSLIILDLHNTSVNGTLPALGANGSLQSGRPLLLLLLPLVPEQCACSAAGWVAKLYG